MDTNQPHVHAVPKEAEAAAAAAVAPHIAGIKIVILALMKTAGDAGLIPSEVPGLINTVRRRFVDLQKAGLIKPNGETRANERGMKETVYILGLDEKAAAIKSTPFTNLKTAVLTLLKKNGGPIDGLVKEAADRCGQPDIEVWTKDAYVMVRREDFDALEKLTKGAA